MTVEVLYVADCPNHEPAVQQLKIVLADHGIAARVVEILVADQPAAESLNFRGSPTIRINGVDIEPPAPRPHVGLSCRTYLEQGRPVGVPPLEVIRRAIQAAQSSGEGT